MNLILLETEDFIATDRVRLTDRRLVHARKHLKLATGDRVRVGLIDDTIGHAEVEGIDRDALELRVELGTPPPAPSGWTLAFALPRPPTLDKVLQQGTAMGVKRFLVFHSRRVEKSYWDASALEPAALRRQLLLGLEQSCDTVLPEIEFHPRFRPFVEDRLARARTLGPVVVGSLGNGEPCPVSLAGPATLVLGPEGGFIPYEVERFESAGDRLVHLGPRVLRVETAAVALLARLAPLAPELTGE